jgi:K+-sensing histidine kinase KdpD
MRKQSENRIMICVTQQKSCERLIKQGAKLRIGKDELFVIHVVKEDWRYFSEMKESDALDYLFEVSKAYQANLTVLKSPEIETTLSKFAEKNKVNIIVMGESKEKLAQQNMIKRLKGKIKAQVSFEIVPDDDLEEMLG